MEENLPEEITAVEPSSGVTEPTTLMRLRFCEEYVKTGNARESARRAGYGGGDRALDVAARRLLRRDDVGALIAEHLRKLLAPEEANSILADIARSSVANFLVIDPKTRQPTGFEFASPRAQESLHTIKKLKFRKDGSVEIELFDKLAAVALVLRNTRFDDPVATQRRAVEAFLAMLPDKVRERVLRLVADGFTEPAMEVDAEPISLPAGVSPEAVADLAWLSDLESAAEAPPPADEEGDDEFPTFVQTSWESDEGVSEDDEDDEDDP